MNIAIRWAALLALALPGIVRSASPILTYLNPAGGQLGTTVTVTMGGGFPRWPVRAWCSDPRVEITPLKESGKISVRIPADLLPRVVWIRMHDADGASAPRPFVLGRLTEITETEPNNESIKAQAITGNVLVNGRFDKSGDVDHYKVSLKKGQTLIAAMQSGETILSPTDSVLQLLGSNGFVLAQNHDTRGLDPQITFTAPKDGDYVVRAFSFPAQPDSTIGLYGNDTAIYRLTLTTGVFPDHLVPLAVERKNPGKVAVQGWNIKPELAELPVTINGAEAWVDHPGLPGILPVGLTDLPVITKHDAELTPPFAITRRLTRNDEIQTLRIAGKKGASLHISVHSRQLGLAVTPNLRLLGANGEELVRAVPPEINTDSELRFTPTADGPLTAELRDQFGHSGPRSVYLLKVRPPTPDFEVSAASDRITLKAGAGIDVPLTVTRRDGLAGDFLAEATGLPAGVTMKIVPPAKGKEDGKTVTVRFDAKPTAQSGAIKLTLKSIAKPELSRTVRAVIPEQNISPVSIEHLWLAVTSEPAPKEKK